MIRKAATRALSALAHETRLEAFQHLVEAGDDGRTPGELGALLNIPATTLSFHLSQLSNADLVATKRMGRSTIYRVDFDMLQELMDFLTKNCCRKMSKQRPAQSPQSRTRRSARMSADA